jgi:hypothetical protein
MTIPAFTRTAPTRVEVTEVVRRRTTRVIHDGTTYPGNPELFAEGERINGGETVAKTEVFSLRDKPNLVGWRVDFYVAIPKGRGSRIWSWGATDFVPVPLIRES